MSSLPTLLVRGRLRLGADRRASDEIPAEYITAWMQRRMPEFGGRAPSMADRVLVVLAETGSGKSTTLPVAVFRILRNEKTPPRQRFRGPGVLCTQPRVLTAIALANDVSSRPWNPDMVLGQTVGFQTGPVSNKPASGLVYATAGVLAAQLRSVSDDKIMDMYRFILVDEAHERSLDNDVTLMMLRNFYSRNVGNDRLPFLMLTSATFDPLRYAEYFGVGSDNVVEVVGRTHRITTHWPANGTNNYPAEAAKVALRIHREHQDDAPARADVLVFVPGAGEAQVVAFALLKAQRESADDGARPFLVLSINREVVASQSGDYPLVFVRPDLLPLVGGAAPLRRIIVSTVVAETGITIDTLRYVVDCGWSRSEEMYQPWGAQGLITRPAPQSRIHQRKGRAGRLFPGDFYPLYTENVYDALDAQQLPEIITRGCSDALLAVISEQQRQKLRTGARPEFKLEDLTLLDPPPPEAFLAANSTAVLIGFVSDRAALPRRWPPSDDDGVGGDGDGELSRGDGVGGDGIGDETARGYGLTQLGHIAASFSRTPMEGVRALLASYMWGAAVSDVITAVAMFGERMNDLLASRGRVKPGVTSDLPPGALALRASLPSFLVARHGGSAVGLMGPSESEEFYFRAKLLLADDFVEAVLMFDAFARRVDASQGDLGAVASWCADSDINFDAMLDLSRRRELIVEEMIVAGLNPFRLSERRVSALPVTSFTEGVRALKRCLYDGLRCRLLRYEKDHPSGATYVTMQGLRVLTPRMFTDANAARLKALRVTNNNADEIKPQWLVTDEIRLSLAPKSSTDVAQPLLYVAEANLVSVLDGYVDPDTSFCEPRSFDESAASE